MALGVETEQQRSNRRRQRILFDGVAELYEATRPGYLAEAGVISLTPRSRSLSARSRTSQPQVARTC